VESGKLRRQLGLWYARGVLVSTVTALLAARGGDVVGAAWGSAGLTDTGVFDFPSDADVLAADGSAVVLGRWNPAKTASLTLRFTPAGSTSLPMDLILVPE